jgi:hypothetical protein
MRTGLAHALLSALPSPAGAATSGGGDGGGDAVHRQARCIVSAQRWKRRAGWLQLTAIVLRPERQTAAGDEQHQRQRAPRRHGRRPPRARCAVLNRLQHRLCGIQRILSQPPKGPDRGRAHTVGASPRVADFWEICEGLKPAPFLCIASMQRAQTSDSRSGRVLPSREQLRTRRSPRTPATLLLPVPQCKTETVHYTHDLE